MKVLEILKVMGILAHIVYSDHFHFKTHVKHEDSWLTPFIKNIPVQRKLNVWRQNDRCKCGIPQRGNHSERIVGGIVSKKNAWPWMAAIVFIGDKSPKLLCGASVINKKYLLTAAHCAEYLQIQGIEKFRIYLGTNNLNDTEAIIPQLDYTIMHPKYDTETKEYDVALLKLKFPLKFSSCVHPICIAPQHGAPYTNKKAIVAGWGTTMFGGVPTTMQMQTMVSITTNKLCTEKYLKSEESIKIFSIMMCASADGADSCQGDSGSPLFINRKGSPDVFEQIGIVSFGSGCADERFPGVYTRVGKVLNWIKSTTSDATYCNMNA